MIEVIILIKILITIGIGFTSSSIGMFLQWFYRWNIIGQRYIQLLRLVRIKIKNKYWKNKWEAICYPLGYCSFCQTAWISIILTIFLIGLNPIFILMGIGSNYYFLEKFDRFLYPRFN